MQKFQNLYRSSASDLVNFMHCHHLTKLSKLVADKLLTKPHYHDPFVEMLQMKGQDFENAFLQQLRAEQKHIVTIDRNAENSTQDTIDAMHAGADVIYQAHLALDNFHGYADFLIRTDKPSALGNFSYEVYDTKLAAETKSGAVIQICLYSEIVAQIQQLDPEFMYIMKPNGRDAFRYDDFAAFLRQLKKRFLHFMDNTPDTYPEPVPHCDICPWWATCDKQRRSDDHLSFVADITKANRKVLLKHNIDTLEKLASLPDPLPFKPEKGSVNTFLRLRHQAALQRQVRQTMSPAFDILPLEEDKGLLKLPEPTKHDVYFDLEGDPMTGVKGREYMFGYTYQNEYVCHWAETEAAEKEAFEQFMDFIAQIRAIEPNMHIFHYGGYENGALKRLAAKHLTRHDALDVLLRANTLVDLLSVVKHTLRAGVERYSLKDLEVYHGFSRQIDLMALSPVKRNYEFLLQTNQLAELNASDRDIIRGYNEDDCRSTVSLHQWLEGIRDQQIAQQGWEIPRPNTLTAAEDKEKEYPTKALFQQLMESVPVDAAQRSPEQQAQFLLASILDWYWREKKSFYWNLYRLSALSPEDMVDEHSGIGMLSFQGTTVVGTDTLHEYAFPAQEFDLKADDSLKDNEGNTIGSVYRIDEVQNRIFIKKAQKHTDARPEAIFKFENIRDENKSKAIIRLAKAVIEKGIRSEDPDFLAARNLLLRTSPFIRGSENKPTDTLQHLLQSAQNLDGGVLSVQGPPGAGKSYSASKTIVALARQGKKIGITAMSYKVMTNLLSSVRKEDGDLSILLLGKEKSPNWDNLATITAGKFVEKTSRYQIIAGTPFFWSREEMQSRVDYLFVDEAGQLSLVDTLAAAGAARNLVLMGDPQQLKQPIQGMHPEGTALSSLEHILNGESTIPEDMGIFLPTSYRMHADVCSLVSELYYRRRLHPDPDNKRISFSGKLLRKPGLYTTFVEHQGNTTSSVEEIEAIRQLLGQLCDGQHQYTDKEGKTHTLSHRDIKIIAPFNAQVDRLKLALPDLEIGTVDKFQGQEAPVIIYSMACSHPEDVPRGMEFLYSQNRFNVAISRAKGACILVCSPDITTPECKTPDQLRLANGLCRYLEVAGVA